MIERAPVASHVDRVNREVYKVSKCDIGFEVVNIALTRIIARELDIADEQHKLDVLTINALRDEIGWEPLP